MDYQKSIAEYIKSHGIKVKYIADNAHIDYELLRRALQGTRKMTANEFGSIITCLGIGIDDLK